MRPPSSTSSRADDGIRREAAAWFAKLRGPEAARHRTTFEAWRDADPAHAAMFDRLSRRWDEAGVLAGSERLKPRLDAAPTRARFRWGLVAGLGLGGALAAGALVGMAYWPPASDLAPPLRALGWSSPIATPVGDIRRLRLPDGSVITLDTDTAVALRFIGPVREIRLLRGRVEIEAVYESGRPLRVSAGRTTTSASVGDFDVSLSMDQAASVALVAGDVAVETRTGPWPIAGQARRLAPGEQLRLAKDPSGPVATPVPAYQISWPRGVLDFRATPLGEALAEVNRYGRQKIVLQDPALADLKISGRVYPTSTGDFAAGVAAMFDLSLSRAPGGDFILSRRAAR
jgi:transmembrane sensor